MLLLSLDTPTYATPQAKILLLSCADGTSQVFLHVAPGEQDLDRHAAYHVQPLFDADTLEQIANVVRGGAQRTQTREHRPSRPRTATSRMEASGLSIALASFEVLLYHYLLHAYVSYNCPEFMFIYHQRLFVVLHLFQFKPMVICSYHANTEYVVASHTPPCHPYMWSFWIACTT